MGHAVLVLTEGALFGYLLFSYVYYAVQLDPAWMPTGILHCSWRCRTRSCCCSAASRSGGASAAYEQGRRGRQLLGIGARRFCSAWLFIGVQLQEWHDKPFSLRSSLYGSLFYTITGFHMAHVVAGVIALAWSSCGRRWATSIARATRRC